MNNRSHSLDRYTWDQAAILGLGTARGFKAMQIDPSTIRHWSAAGHITPVGKAPGGAFLYSIAAVSKVAEVKTRDSRKAS